MIWVFRVVVCLCVRPLLSAVQAKLTDGREFAASIVGSDPATDVAVLRLNAAGPFPVVPMGDSSKLRVGQVSHVLEYISSYKRNCVNTKTQLPRKSKKKKK